MNFLNRLSPDKPDPARDGIALRGGCQRPDVSGHTFGLVITECDKKSDSSMKDEEKQEVTKKECQPDKSDAPSFKINKALYFNN